MVKESQVSAMEIDDSKSNNADLISPKFSFNVLHLLKTAQMQHGLRHGDYTRYRRYCTARLRRLYKSLKFTHGRGRYLKKAITESIVTDVRFLHLVLYTAERAWSHAMEKRQLPDGPNASQRIYLMGRLRKAVKWATLFSQLCAVKGDSRTSLEAEAYASYMKGTLLFEQDQNWETALMNFKSARAVYEELGKYGDVENQVLCRERVEELEPSIRYCLHKIGQSNLQASELLQVGEVEGPALDLFKSKLEAVMAEARSQQAASMTEFHWLGHKFPISNAKTRVAILKAQELEKDVHGSGADSLASEKKLAIYDKIFSAYHEARSCIRSDLASVGSAENVKDELYGLDKAVSAILGQRTIERNQLLVKTAKSKLIRRRDDKNEKVTRPEELVRLYDLLLQNTSDLSDLVSSGRDRKQEEVTFAEECELKSLMFRVERWVRAVEFFSILYSSPYLHKRRKMQTSPLPIPLESSIDEGPYVNFAKDGMVAALGEDEMMDKVETTNEPTASIEDDGNTPASVRYDYASEQVDKECTAEPSEQNVNNTIDLVKRRLDQLSRQSCKSIWILASIAVVTTSPWLALWFVWQRRKGGRMLCLHQCSKYGRALQ